MAATRAVGSATSELSLPIHDVGHWIPTPWNEVLPLVGMGCSLFLATVCAIMLEFFDRRRPLWLSISLCVALAAYCGLVAIKPLDYAPHQWLVSVPAALTVLMAILSGLVPWLVAEYFQMPRRQRWLLGLGVLLVLECLLISDYEVRELWLSRTMLVAVLALSSWALFQGLRFAWVVWAAAFLRLTVVMPSKSVFIEPTAFVIVAALVLYLCRSLAIEGRAARTKVRAATLTAARLELELLKKNIQPHFLLNTLATVIEVVEQEPRTAVTLIEALASEFRVLARVSGEKLIPLWQELELCHSHLRIMSIRRSIRCSLTTTGMNEDEFVPPGLFHTLIEGGLTHQLPRDGELRFTLDAVCSPHHARYTLIAHGETRAADNSPIDGTGLRYVKARLEESFAGRWSFTAGPVADGWRTVIEIATRRRAGVPHEDTYRGGRTAAGAAFGTFLPGDPREPAGDAARGDGVLAGERLH